MARIKRTTGMANTTEKELEEYPEFDYETFDWYAFLDAYKKEAFDWDAFFNTL